MGGIGAVAEPLVVVALLIVGTSINRDIDPGRRKSHHARRISSHVAADGPDTSWPRSRDIETLLDEEDLESAPSTSPNLLPTSEPEWRHRRLGIFGVETQRLPFLVECWYWALIYWVYQLGRAATAVGIVEGTVVAARNHALKVIAAEEKLQIFWELGMQKLFLQNIFVITWINRTYSFIHIPGSIAFLIWLFYYTNTRNRIEMSQSVKDVGEAKGSQAGPSLYEARRRTMAFCNLLAFIVFTVWPCMPPRLLSADTSDDALGKLARSYGFVDTVHGPHREGSIWTDNRFTNKYAAMPSLHFGYSLLIGMTIATIPLNGAHSSATSFIVPFMNRSHPSLAPKITIPSWRRLLCIFLGVFYPTLILVAIITTANHFILDAVAGSIVCAAAWYGNDVLLNLLVLEDWFLWVVRIHKPESVVVETEEEDARESTKDLMRR